MKKSLLLSSLLFASASAVCAQEAVEPLWLPDLYFVTISSNGRYMGSMTGGSARVYDAQEGKTTNYETIMLGLGNTISDDGVIVGNEYDRAMICIDGSFVNPPSLRDYWFSDLNAITRDGSRFIGLLNNPNRRGQYIPFYCDRSEDGTVSDPVLLPYPEKDFFGMPPQFVTAVWISDDGKKIIGQVQDDMGYYEYPIVFVEDENGEWDYFLPTESLFNPNNLDIPENPWKDEPPYPEVENYMEADSRILYQEQYNLFIQDLAPWPNPFEYMTPQQQAEYEAAAETYNEWYDAHQSLFRPYMNQYFNIIDSSVDFNANELALHPSGDYFVCSGYFYNDSNIHISSIYRISIPDGEIEEFVCPVQNMFPNQVLPDGTIVITRPYDQMPTCHLILPGSTEFTSLKTYLESTNPGYLEWMNEKIPNATGIVNFSEDMSIFCGGLIPDDYAEYSEASSFFYSSYIFGLDMSGVNDIVDDADNSILRVFNLQGLNVMTTSDKADLNRLPSGIYIVNGKKHYIKN